MAFWCSADQQQGYIGGLAKPVAWRRISEWPVVFDLDEWDLWMIDEVSISFRNIHGAFPELNRLPSNSITPTQLWNVLVCGIGAPIITTLMIRGARMERLPMFRSLLQPLLIFCEIDPDKNLMGDKVFRRSFIRKEVLEVLEDLGTRIDTIAWYDVGAEETFHYLKTIKNKRDLYRPECPIVVYAPIPSWEKAINELISSRLGRPMSGGPEIVYEEITQAIKTKGDIDPYGYLQKLP